MTTTTSSCALEFGSILKDFCAVELPIDVSYARSVKIEHDSQRIFVLERGTQSIVHLWDSDGDGIPDTKQVVASETGLNHGLALLDGYIYASSDTTVYRWNLYDENDQGQAQPKEFPLAATDSQAIVTNINADGMGGAPKGHTTRTIAFDEASGTMYVSVGSNVNVDPDSHRSRIRKFEGIRSTTSNDTFPLDFQTMPVFADGLRNEVGLAFDKHGILWGVENSADNLVRDDLGGDIHNDNPAEELNRFHPQDPIVRHYGYPYCWTEYNLPLGKGRGTQWAWPSFHVQYGGTLEDAECSERYEPPALAMQAHSAPLGLVFFDWVPPLERPSTCQNVKSFPKRMDGFCFMAFHGSWNRDIPTGYKVVYVEMDANGNLLEGSAQPVVDLLAHQPPNAKWEDGFRPVDVAFDACGRLLVTSDGTRGRGSKVVRIEYQGEETTATETTLPPQSSASFGWDDRILQPTTTTILFLCLSWVLLAMR